MAHIFKHPEKNNKGILVFTHKEWGFFTGNKLIRKLKREGKIPRFLYSEMRPFYKKQLSKIKDKYLIGVHHGFYYPHLLKSDFADFLMSRESNVPNLNEKILRLPLNSREFIPSIFSKKDTEKTYDIMTVARDVKFKNWPLMFKSIKKCLEDRPETTFLLIMPSQEGVKYGVEKGIANLFYNTFNEKQQSKIAFLYLHPKLHWGLNQTQLVEFYNRSKLFTLFSKMEGESRVISEALCCNIPVVTYSKLLGGGTDLLTDENSVMFDNYDDAHKAWIEALERFPDGVKDAPEKVTREDYTIDKLHPYFSELYKSSEMDYDENLINLDNLDRRLPAHDYSVPWMKKGDPTADILSKKQFKIFLQSLTLKV